MDDFFCKCPPGYTGQGDLAFKGTAGCSIHVVTVQILYGIAMGVHVVVLVFSLYFARRKWEHWRNNKGGLGSPVLIGVFLALCSTAFMPLAILRISNPETATLGTDPAVTALTALAMWFVWASIFMITYNLVQMAAMQLKVYTRYERMEVIRMRARVFLLGTFAVLNIPIWLLVGLLYLGDEHMFNSFAATHYVMFFIVTMIMIPTVVSQVLAYLIQEIDKVIEGGKNSQNKNEQRLVGVRTQLSSMKKQAWIHGMITGLAQLLMGAVPLFRVNSSYFFPISWTHVSLVMMFETYNMLPVRANPSSPASRAPADLTAPEHVSDL